MNIAIISDCHLGRKSFRKTHNNINVIEYEGYKQWESFIDNIVKENPDILLITGDIFEKENPTSLAIDKACKGFNRLEKAGIQTLVVGGNHDFSYFNYLSGSHPFKNLENYEHIKFVYKDFGTYETEEFLFTLLPHQPLVIDKNTGKFNDNALKKACKEIIKINKNSDKKRVLVTHGAIESWSNSFITNQEEDKELEKYSDISGMVIPDLVVDQFDYVFIGHIHKPLVQSFKSIRGTSFRVSPGSTINEKLEEENEFEHTGPLYFNTENGVFNRYIIDSIKIKQIVLNNVEEFREFVSNMGEHIYSILFNGDLTDIPNDLYNEAMNKSLFFNLRINKQENLKEGISSIKDFWSYVKEIRPDFIDEFKNVMEGSI